MSSVSDINELNIDIVLIKQRRLLVLFIVSSGFTSRSGKIKKI